MDILMFHVESNVVIGTIIASSMVLGAIGSILARMTKRISYILCIPWVICAYYIVFNVGRDELLSSDTIIVASLVSAIIQVALVVSLGEAVTGKRAKCIKRN